MQTEKFKMIRLLFLFLVFSLISGCGGSGGGSSPPTNSGPFANAGADQAAGENTSVTLSGSGSSDSDGTIATYAWTQTSGPTVSLASASQVTTTFTAPAVSVATVLSFQLAVTDNDGARSTDTVSVTINDITNSEPTANAGVDQTVNEVAVVTLDGSGSLDTDGMIASFAWTQTAGPAVTLSDASNVMPTFTAPTVTADATLNFQLVVTDDGGATNSDTVVVNVINLPNMAPTANAGSDQMVAEGVVVTLDGSMSADADGSIASYSWSQSVGPAVVVTGADTVAPTFTTPDVTADTTFTFALTVTDDLGLMTTDTVDIVVSNAVSSVTITGKVTYDHVEHNQNTNGLNFNNVSQDPVRGATVQALDASNGVLATAKTNDSGDYSLVVAPSTQVRIRTRAEIIQVGPPSWDVRVVDNTSSGAAYVLDGSLADSGTVNSTRDLNAASGWSTALSTYNAPRAAAPFAILDSMYTAVTETAAVDPAVVFPPLLANWSVNNVPSSCAGGNAQGCIGTSNYDRTAIFILGAANNDTDEFDGHIVVHEWGHYFEEKLSRSDSMGGPHSGADVLDIRIAFGEGFGNGLAGIITGDPSYRDSLGTNQANGFEINVENNNADGWFSESTVQSLLYDFYDNSADGATDTLALGWGPLYRAFVADEYRNTDARISIHAYLKELKAQNAGSAAAITALASSSNVNDTDEFGAGETTVPAGSTGADVLPIYTEVEANGAAVEVCSINRFGTFNKLSNRRLLKLEISAAGVYRFQAAGGSGSDPDLAVYKNSTTVAILEAIGNENDTATLTPGTHVLEVYDFCNIQPGSSGCPSAGNTRSCINVTVTQL